MNDRTFDLHRAWLAACVIGLTAGAVSWLAGERDVARLAWALTTAIGGVPITLSVARGLLAREPGVDLIALLAMVGCARAPASTWPAR